MSDMKPQQQKTTRRREVWSRRRRYGASKEVPF
jgi:hypothetical protein